MRKCLCLLSAVLCLAVSASHITETLVLAKGWNAVYLESTPDGDRSDPDCATFFRGMPVTKVGCYRSDAYANTEQYGVDGKEIVQKPLSYTVWMKDEPQFSTLNSLRGGQCYLIFATEPCSKTFTGIPAAPRLTWRKATTTGEGFMNLAGVSVGGLETPLAAKYFGEGPFGSGKLYTVSGVDSAAPTFASSTLFGAPKVQNGKAYALTADRDEDWPGVVEVRSAASNGGLDFADGAVQDSITVRNRGTAKRVFRLTVVGSVQTGAGGEDYPDGLMRKIAVSVTETAWSNVVRGTSWEVELEPNEARSCTFAIDRAKLDAKFRYGAVLEVEDLGASRMRVRVPITVDATVPTTYPQGLWIGSVQLSHVSFGDAAATALPAAGRMKATVLLHVAETGGTVTMLPHVALAENSNGVVEVFHELDKARAVNADARRLTSVMLGTETKPPQGEGAFEGEGGLTFRYVIRENEVDNPFRHAFHPDHDGLNASYTETAPSGDNIANYASGDIKPELWSVSNTVKFVWRDDTGKPTVAFSPEGISCGVVEWKVEGLKSAPILMRGMFAVRRLNDAGEVKK